MCDIGTIKLNKPSLKALKRSPDISLMMLIKADA